MYGEIQGIKNNTCLIFVRYEDVPNIGDVNMTCESPRKDNNTFVRILEDINNVHTFCEGTLISYFVQ